MLTWTSNERRREGEGEGEKEKERRRRREGEGEKELFKNKKVTFFNFFNISHPYVASYLLLTFPRMRFNFANAKVRTSHF